MSHFESGSGLDLVADVGGTHARIAEVTCGPNGKLALANLTKYKCAEYTSLAQIIEQYSTDRSKKTIRRIGIAIAGVLDGDNVTATNLPWAVSLAEVKASQSETDVVFLNDYQAAAMGSEYLDVDDSKAITECEIDSDGVAVTIGVGTGLGAAIRVGRGSSSRILPTELGQMRLRAHTKLEKEVHQMFAEKEDFVRLEYAISGPGLVNVYGAICSVLGLAGSAFTPAEIVSRALSNQDNVATSSVKMIAGMLAEALADLAMMVQPTGGIFLTGGVTPHLMPFLDSDDFRKRFFANKRMCSRLFQIPIRIVTRGEIGLVGAAYYLNNRELIRGGQI